MLRFWFLTPWDHDWGTFCGHCDDAMIR